MIITVLFVLLFLSFTIHILIVVFYVSQKSKSLFYAFIITALLNISIGMALSIVAMSNPELVQRTNAKFILWILSGFTMILLLIIKIYFFRNIYLRTKDPAMYHFNYFGKKVYNKGIVKQYEYVTLFLSMPFFLLLGAYFMARLINIFLYGHI